MTKSKRRIRAQPSDRDPMTMRFLLDAEIQPGNGATFTASEIDHPPLASALFEIEAVERVHVSGATIHVGRGAQAEWDSLKPRIAQTIRAVLDSCDSPLGVPQQHQDDDDTRLLARIQDLLDRQANPAIAAHGGRVSVDRVENARVYLRFAGGCQGCAASSKTLRDGIETMLRAALPKLGEIVDVTDHSAGVDPYYKASGGQSPKLARPVPASAVDQSDGELRIDPEFLAGRLGLTPEVLIAGMANGDIQRHVETLAREAGTVTQVAIFTPTRAWAANLHENGQIFEVPPPRRPTVNRPKDQQLLGRIRAHLNSLDPDKGPITYGSLARAVGMYLPGSVSKVTQALETTMREDAEVGKPFVAAQVVNRHSGLPGKGFFDLAKDLGEALPADADTLSKYRQRLYQRP